jgi:CRP-like cAMP-binding protein
MAKRRATLVTIDAAAAIAGSPILGILSDAERRALADKGKRASVAKKTDLFHLGDPCHDVLVVLRGEVRLWRATPSGQVLVLRTAPAGEVLGQMSALDEGKHSVNATADEAVELLRIPAAAFRGALEKNGVAALALARALAERVRELSEELEAMKFSTIGERVLRRLQAKAAGRRELKTTHEKLAQEVGSTRENVSRVLEMLRDAGILALGRGRIEILDHERLARVSIT